MTGRGEDGTMAGDAAGPLYDAVCAAVPQLARLLGLPPGAVGSWSDVEAAIGRSALADIIATEELGRGGLPMSHGQGTLVAALLARAGYAHMAQQVRPDFWEAMESLDRANGALLLRLLADGRWD